MSTNPTTPAPPSGVDPDARAAHLAELLERERRARTADDVARVMSARGSDPADAAAAAAALLQRSPERVRFTEQTGELVATFAGTELRGRAAVDQFATELRLAAPPDPDQTVARVHATRRAVGGAF